MQMALSEWQTDFEEAKPGALRAWVAMLAVALLVAACLLVGQAAALRLLFPAASLVTGVYLYYKYPAQYVSFVWWVWMLSPFVRRLVDWQSGWVDPSPVLLAPVLVSCVAGAGFLRHFLPSVRNGGLPFVLAFAGVLYGLGVGLIRSGGDYTLAQPMLTWLVPIFLGFHLFINWREYPAFRRELGRTFVVGALLMGVYGVVQFLSAPMWDRFWMVNIEYGSFGTPEPLGIRVFSTLNAPGPFSVVMMAALLVLFGSQGWLRFPAAVTGYLSFLLCMTRAAWIGWLVGFATLLAKMESRARLKLIAVVVLFACAIVPLATLEPFASVVGPRIQSMTNPKDDISLAARLEGYGKYFRDAVTDPFGKGIGIMDREYAIAPDDEGIGPHDSAVLELLLSLGFLGAALYGAGLIALLFGLRVRGAVRADSFANAARAVGLGMFAQLILGSVMLGVMGAILWSFAGVVIAASKYHAEFARQPVMAEGIVSQEN